jgi:alkyl sulfatase BDS1-like metallo-beta-lactamase superfamily hydrolase
VTVSDVLTLSVGDESLELHHAKGETDDHLWTYLPKRKVICAGDFFIWCFPNAGNPQKVQRYPLEWAAALREMTRYDVELFMPAHGLPIVGHERIVRVLSDVALALEQLVERTVAKMNDGATLNEILHEVAVDPALLEKPYLLPLYDEPEFVVRNIYRLYGGWYDGNPSQLKPARQASVAHELVSLAGGVSVVVKRALELCAASRSGCLAADRHPKPPTDALWFAV